MDTLFRDIRYSLRLLLKQPGFTTLAIICLALGIGASTAIFSVVNGVLLRPLPFPGAGQLVAAGGRDVTGQRKTVRSSSPPDFVDFRTQAKSAEFAAYYNITYSYRGADVPERVAAAVVSSNLFHVLGVSPMLGRGFLAEEELPKRDREVVLGYDFWKQQFSGDRRAIGKTLRLDATDYVIVGVMPAGFAFPIQAEASRFWTPMTLAGDSTFEQDRGDHYISVVGRMKPGFTVKQVDAELRAISDRLRELHPSMNANFFGGALPLSEQLTGDARPALLVLAGAVCFLLLIACANVANLMLSRVTLRAKEMAVRTALGAARRRIVRQLLTESVILALAGGALGILLASWGKDFLLSTSPMAVPRAAEVSIDWVVVTFTTVVCVLTGVLFGLAPAMQIVRADLNSTLKEAGRSITGPGSARRMRNGLVAAEIALSLMLLAGAGLLSGSLLRLEGVDPGFQSKDVFTARLRIPELKYKSNLQQADFYDALVDRVRAIPGVTSAAAVTVLPLSGNNMMLGMNIEGETRPRPTDFVHVAQFDAVTPDYFRTMEIPLKAGRVFTSHDDSAATPVVIINEALVKTFFPGQNPLGKKIAVAFNEGPMREIVGVVGDIRRSTLSSPPEPTAYTPERQTTMPTMVLVARTAGSNAAFAGAFRRELSALDPDQSASTVRRLDDVIADSLAPRRFTVSLLAIFAVVALSLSAVGVFGVMTSMVTQRSREIAVRVALGARPRDVFSLVLSHGLTLAAIGVGAGLVGAFALSRVLTGLLFGIGATDPFTLATAALLLGAVALIACYLPARRATRLDPITVLKDE
ncbi:MAG TPA: ABC transporter permease [Gemmatimonadaceae bacterium]|nr:ABC transporter permease [Gemmatimonadaceae bacterium]